MENEMIILKDIIVTDLLSYMYIIGKTRQIRNDHFTLEGCLVFCFFSVANFIEKRNLHEICKIEINLTSYMLWCPLQFPQKNDVPFVFTSICLHEVLFTLHVFVLRIVVFNTYCVVFLVCLSSSCAPYVASFSGLSILITPTVLSGVYFLWKTVLVWGGSGKIPL